MSQWYARALGSIFAFILLSATLVPPKPSYAEPLVFAEPVNLAEINSVYSDAWPALSADGLEILFTSDRPGGAGNWDLWRATRPTVSSPFGAPTCVVELNTPGIDGSPCLTQDGLSLYFSCQWAPLGPASDIYVATRPNRASPFSAPRPVIELNTPDFDGSPCISTDGLTMYWARNVTPYNEDPYFAKRNSVNGSFGLATRIDALTTPYYERDFSISSDQLTLFFSSNRPSTAGPGFHIYTSTRPALDRPFGPAQLLAGVNGGFGEAGPYYDEARSLLYFAADYRPGGLGATDIWVAQAVPEPFSLAFMGCAFVGVVAAGLRKRATRRQGQQSHNSR